jgi:LPS-assembly lipoprotein
VALPVLAACGFSPAYAPGGPALVLRNAVRPDRATSDIGFAFATRIEERLGPAREPAFLLGFDFDLDVEGLARTPDNSILRYNLAGRVRYALRRASDGAVLTSGVAESFVSYSAIGTTVATRASQTDAYDRLAVILADEVVTRLIAAAPALAA